MMVVEIVRLVQAALAIWGLFGIGRDELDVNGLFCDETKAGIFKWRHIMGMEKETLKLEVSDPLEWGGAMAIREHERLTR